MWPAPAHMYKTASAYSDERAGDFGEHRQMRCKDASSRVAGALAARAGAKGASKRRACLCAPSFRVADARKETQKWSQRTTQL